MNIYIKGEDGFYIPFAKINDIDITETDGPAEYEDMKISDNDEFTASIDLSRKQLKNALRIFHYPQWMATQAAFPRKKKRGRMRRMRHLRRLIKALTQDRRLIQALTQDQ